MTKPTMAKAYDADAHSGRSALRAPAFRLLCVNGRLSTVHARKSDGVAEQAPLASAKLGLDDVAEPVDLDAGGLEPAK